MKLSTLLLTIIQATVALSWGPTGRPSPDDEPDTINATDPATHKIAARDCWPANGAGSQPITEPGLGTDAATTKCAHPSARLEV
ncbi:MAG: hypothetical protein Q9182_007125 [Xanthomendoza sp. 2 TL-2023]